PAGDPAGGGGAGRPGDVVAGRSAGGAVAASLVRRDPAVVPAGADPASGAGVRPAAAGAAAGRPGAAADPRPRVGLRAAGPAHSELGAPDALASPGGGGHAGAAAEAVRPAGVGRRDARVLSHPRPDDHR